MLLKVLSDLNISLEKALEETNGYYISGEINSTVKDPDAKMHEVLSKSVPHFSLKILPWCIRLLNVGGKSAHTIT
jgi:hypothetical protein